MDIVPRTPILDYIVSTSATLLALKGDMKAHGVVYIEYRFCGFSLSVALSWGCGFTTDAWVFLCRGREQGRLR